DDALMLDTRGFMAETNATHIFIVSRDANAFAAAGARAGEPAVLTPFCHACPEGITRATVIGLCRTNNIAFAERDLSLTEVYRAEEMFCTGTMGELAPVLAVDGRKIGDGHPGAMTKRLAGLFRKLTETEGERLVE